MASRAAELLADLVGQGYSQAMVARALGRDPSLMSRVAHGKIPGDRYVSALADLARGRPATPPAHRTGGTTPRRVALVRGRAVAELDSVKGVRAAIANAGRRTSDPLPGGGRVSLTIHGVDAAGRPVIQTLFRKGGWDARQVRASIDEALQRRGVDPARASQDDIAGAIADVAADTPVGDGGGKSGAAPAFIQSVTVGAP